MTRFATSPPSSRCNRNRVVSFIQANPGTCLIGAVAVGFLIGKIAARR
jgi:hypothetical protein